VFKWIELLLQNSKAVGALILVLMSGLGFSGWTIFDQQEELIKLRPIEVKVEVPDEIKELKKDVETLKKDTKSLRKWHE
jgi:hypothetical protein